MFEQPQNGMLFLGGQKISGSDIRDQNGKVSSEGQTSSMQAGGLPVSQSRLHKRSRMS
jgi:hypothetical protein